MSAWAPIARRLYSYCFSTCPNSRSTGAAEDGHRDFDTRSGFIDFLDHAVEGGERPVRHPHVFANLEPYRSFRPLDAVGHLSLDPIRFNIGNRHRFLVRAQEAGHLGRVLDQVVGLVGEVAFDEDIAGKELALGVDLAPPAHLDDLLGRYEDFLELVGEAALARLLANGFSDLLLEVGIGVNDVPAHSHIWAIRIIAEVSRRARSQGREKRLFAAPRRRRGRTGS